MHFREDPHAYRGRVLAGGDKGHPVHAASDMRRREVVLDRGLLRRPDELARILVHELFHFVWVRLGNRERLAWEQVLGAELDRGARGELGWSAEMRKQDLTPADLARRTRRWREYACESFCDTAAWLVPGLRSHPEFTLAPRWRAARMRWFKARNL